MGTQQLQKLLTAITTGLQWPTGAFALAPGLVDPTNTLDYTTLIGIKIWHEATAPLSFKFNVEGKEVNTSVRHLHNEHNSQNGHLTEPRSSWSMTWAPLQ
jgi:hypothetical protein